MTYNEFKNEIMESVQKKLNETAGSDFKVETHVFDKVNYSYEGLCICDESKKSSSSPVFNIERFYDEYTQGRKTDDLAEEIVDIFKNTMNVREQHMDMISDAYKDDSRIRDNIIFQLVNTEQNYNVLSDIPHREVEDLSVIYRWIVKEDAEGLNSVIVNNKLADKLSLDEEQLYKLAYENTRRIMPPVVKALSSVVKEMINNTGMSETFDANEVPDNLNMWVVTNDRCLNGATTILYDDVLDVISEKLGNDIYILPASVHDVIVVPATFGDPDSLAMMVTDINMANVELAERLSNQVYLYDRDTRKLSMATCTQYTKLEYPVSQYNQGR